VGNKGVGEVILLKANPITMIVNVGIIILLTTISCVIPLIRLNKIKPKKIIASKE
jgi:ABC-type antimicrobial peptide transport system permease subunit